MKIYLIPGTGADERLFQNIHLTCPSTVIEWVDWQNARSISEYAKILNSQIDESEEFALLGVSFGGMVAVELAKLVNAKYVILVSSAKTYKELPFIVSVARVLGIKWLIFPWLIRRLPFLTRFFGLSKKDKKYFQAMMDSTSNLKLKRIIQSIISWKNINLPDSYLHLHGDLDKMIPIKKIKGYQKIKNGGHFMIMQKGNEISTIINDFIEQKKGSNRP